MNLLNNDHFLYLTIHMTLLPLLEDLNERQYKMNMSNLKD